MTDTLTSEQVEQWLGVSNPTLFKLRHRAVDPLPMPISVRSSRNIANHYSKSAIKEWLKTNPKYPQPYKPRRGKIVIATEALHAFDLPLARAFLTGAFTK